MTATLGSPINPEAFKLVVPVVGRLRRGWSDTSNGWEGPNELLSTFGQPYRPEPTFAGSVDTVGALCRR